MRTVDQITKFETDFAMPAQVSFISDYKHGLNQTYDQTLIEKVRYDQQHMIQQYFNEIANSKQ